MRHVDQLYVSFVRLFVKRVLWSDKGYVLDPRKQYLFDSTLGYPGEGPGQSADAVSSQSSSSSQITRSRTRTRSLSPQASRRSLDFVCPFREVDNCPYRIGRDQEQRICTHLTKHRELLKLDERGSAANEVLQQINVTFCSHCVMFYDHKTSYGRAKHPANCDSADTLRSIAGGDNGCVLPSAVSTLQIRRVGVTAGPNGTYSVDGVSAAFLRQDCGARFVPANGVEHYNACLYLSLDRVMGSVPTDELEHLDTLLLRSQAVDIKAAQAILADAAGSFCTS